MFGSLVPFSKAKTSQPAEVFAEPSAIEGTPVEAPAPEVPPTGYFLFFWWVFRYFSGFFSKAFLGFRKFFFFKLIFVSLDEILRRVSRGKTFCSFLFGSSRRVGVWMTCFSMF